MPTTHKISWATHQEAGINIIQYQKDVCDKTGIPPTNDQIQQFIMSHYQDYFEKQRQQEEGQSEPQLQVQQNQSKSSEGIVKRNPSSLIRNPIHVRCGYKRELHPAFELIGSNNDQIIKGKCHIEWGCNGKKAYVDEVDVVRGELPSRSRTRTDRYEPSEENDDKKPRSKKKLDKEKTHFKPIHNANVPLDDHGNKIFDDSFSDGDVDKANVPLDDHGNKIFDDSFSDGYDAE